MYILNIYNNKILYFSLADALNWNWDEPTLGTKTLALLSKVLETHHLHWLIIKLDHFWEMLTFLFLLTFSLNILCIKKCAFLFYLSSSRSVPNFEVNLMIQQLAWKWGWFNLSQCALPHFSEPLVGIEAKNVRQLNKNIQNMFYSN